MQGENVWDGYVNGRLLLKLAWAGVVWSFEVAIVNRDSG